MRSRSTIRGLSAGVAFVMLSTLAAWAQAAPKMPIGTPVQGQPSILDKVGIDQHLNRQIPLDLHFVDENGRNVTLRQYFGQKPVIITMVYYTCPMLCSQVLNGVTRALNGVARYNVGRDFDVLTVSFDPRDKPEAAKSSKEEYLKRYRRADSQDGWHFLTGSDDQIRQLADALGFRYAWDPQIQQYAHATGIMLATPDGRLAQYYYGIDYSPRDLQLGIVQASQGKVGSLADEVLLYCYHYDPTKGKYGLAIFNVLRIAALATVLALGGFMVIMFRRDAAAARLRS